MSDKQIEDLAISYAKSNKKIIANKFTDINLYPKEESPISIFMAGSPGAGKTETSVRLIETISPNRPVLRIDPDDLRKELPGYNGHNSHLFQSAVSIIVEKIHDLALDKSQSFIFDGTFSNFEKSKSNIQRSIDKNRDILIVFVYQDPLLSWEFVKKRSLKDGRVILRDDFIKHYFNSRYSVNEIKKIFPNVKVDLVIKNIDGTMLDYIQNVPSIDFYIQEKYNLTTLNQSIL